MRKTKPDSEQPGRGIAISESLVIPESELAVSASRSGGPGGQHVNTSSTRVEVVWNVLTSTVLDDGQRERLVRALGGRLTAGGALRVVASDTRSQRQNRELAHERLGAMVRKALVVPKARKRTRPHRGAVEERLASKKLRAGKKRDRRPPGDD